MNRRDVLPWHLYSHLTNVTHFHRTSLAFSAKVAWKCVTFASFFGLCDLKSYGFTGLDQSILFNMAAEPGAGGYEDLLDDDYFNENVRTDINSESFQLEEKLIPLPYDTKYAAAPDMPFKEVLVLF